MQGKKESYKYQDGRDFRLEDGRNKPGYMSLYRDEFLHLYRTCSKTAIGLYGFVGTTVSGNVQGYNVGGKVLQEALGAGRSTLYEALGQLVDAGLVERSTRDGRTVIRLVDVWKSRKQDFNLSESSDNSRPKVRTNREDNSYSNSKKTIPPSPPGGNKESDELVTRIQKLLLESEQALEAVNKGISKKEMLKDCPYGENAPFPLGWIMHRLRETGWNGTYRKRHILLAIETAANDETLQEAKSAFEEQQVEDQRVNLVDHIEGLRDILKLWEDRDDFSAAERTRLQISESESELATLLTL